MSESAVSAGDKQSTGQMKPSKEFGIYQRRHM